MVGLLTTVSAALVLGLFVVLALWGKERAIDAHEAATRQIGGNDAVTTRIGAVTLPIGCPDLPEDGGIRGGRGPAYPTSSSKATGPVGAWAY
jgi:hypothetical protein